MSLKQGLLDGEGCAGDSACIPPLLQNIAVWKHNVCQRKRKSWRNVQGTQDRNSSIWMYMGTTLKGVSASTT